MLTMLLGGLWHGAAWTFVVWGAMHGGFLLINHGWRAITCRHGAFQGRFWDRCTVLLTFVAVVFAWVPFRSASIEASFLVWQAMLGLAAEPSFNLPSLPTSMTTSMRSWLWIAAGLAIVWCLPNSQQTLARVSHLAEHLTEPLLPASKRPLRGPFGLFSGSFSWSFSPFQAVLLGAVLTLCLLNLGRPSEFLYFQF